MHSLFFHLGQCLLLNPNFSIRTDFQCCPKTCINLEMANLIRLVPRHLWWQSLSLPLLSHLTWFPIVPPLSCLQAPIYCCWLRLVFSLLLCLLFLAPSHPRVWLGLDPFLPLWLLLLAPGYEAPIQRSSFVSYCASSFLNLTTMPWFDLVLFSLWACPFLHLYWSGSPCPEGWLPPTVPAPSCIWPCWSHSNI